MNKHIKDMTGRRFGRLVAVEVTEKRDPNNQSAIWLCRCDCENTHLVSQNNLEYGGVKSCGCLNDEKRLEQGKRVGNFVTDNHVVAGTNVKKLTSKMPRNNTSGVKGVTWDKTRNKWVAQIQFRKKNYHLGRFEKKEDAIESRKIAEEKIFGEFLEWYAETHKEKNS